MAYPTRHWRKFTGTLTQGAGTTITHGLRYDNDTTVTPDALLADMDDGIYAGEAPNTSIGPWQTSSTTSIYMSNWDGGNSHYYAFVARSYHTIDDSNL